MTREAVPSTEHTEVAREAFTMAFYVAICLLAALAAVAESVEQSHADSLKIVWGTSLGLALAHWFAFRLSSRLVSGDGVGRHEAVLAAAQLAGAACVALLATIPVLLLPATSELDAVRFLLSALIALSGFAVARTAGASLARSVIYGLVVLALASTVAVLKNVLSHH